MDFKSFYGSTIREALDAARQEFGPDASILASRQVETAPGQPRQFEVVCGASPFDNQRSSRARTDRTPSTPTDTALGRAAVGSPVVKRIPAAAVLVPSTSAKPASGDDQSKLAKAPHELQNGLARLRHGVDSLRQSIIPDRKNNASALEDLRDALLLDGFDANLIAEIAGGIRERLSNASLDAAVVQELEARAVIDASIRRSSAKRKITALVGPTGVGKTSLIVKLAVKYGLKGRRPLRIISLDGVRVGGADTLSTFAAGMAVPIDVVETGTGLLQALEACPDAGMVLIDTPGMSPTDFGASEEMIKAIARHPEIDVHLVVSAVTSPANLKATLARFRPLMPSKIAATQTDATVSSRPVVALALNHELPLSFAGTGPGIPDDITEASVTWLLQGAPSAHGSSAGRTAVSAA